MVSWGIKMKIDFHALTIEDKDWLTRAFQEDGKQSCEFTFANNFLWSRVYHVCVAKCCGCAVLHFTEGDMEFYAFPCGAGDKKAALEALILHADSRGRKPLMTALTEAEVQRLQKWFPEQFEISTNRDDYDYVYRTEDLLRLAGKKYHGKRNHIARFRESDWCYEEIDAGNIGQCAEMLSEWKEQRRENWDESAENECRVVQDAVEWYDRLGLDGGLLRQNGRVVAFCMGEPLNRDTYVVHFEKAFSDVQGAYAAINQQFVEHVCQGFSYVNREEDMGEEGLRRAKMSYRPVKLVEKYRAFLY